MKSTTRKVAILLALGLALSASACSAESTPKAEAAPISVAPSATAPIVTESASAPAVSDQAVAEKEGFYRSSMKWASASTAPDPNGAAGNVASNLNWFLQKVTYEWTNSPSSAFPKDTPTRKVFPKASAFVSQTIPEYEAQKLFAAITNTVDKWRDVRFMSDYRSVEFSKDGTYARVGADAIGATASANQGLFGALNDKHAGADSGYIIFTKEGADWKISGIGGYYGKEDCLWDCS